MKGFDSISFTNQNSGTYFTKNLNTSFLKIKWYSIYIILINIFAIISRINIEPITMIIDILSILFLAFIIYIATLSLQISIEANSNDTTLKKYKLGFDICSVIYIIDFLLALILKNISFFSYDEFEKFYAFIFVIITIIKIALLIMISIVIKNLENSP